MCFPKKKNLICKGNTHVRIGPLGRLEQNRSQGSLHLSFPPPCCRQSMHAFGSWWPQGWQRWGFYHPYISDGAMAASLIALWWWPSPSVAIRWHGDRIQQPNGSIFICSEWLSTLPSIFSKKAYIPWIIGINRYLGVLKELMTQVLKLRKQIGVCSTHITYKLSYIEFINK